MRKKIVRSNKREAKRIKARKDSNEDVKRRIAVIFWLDHALEALGKLQPAKRRDLAIMLESFDWLQRL